MAKLTRTRNTKEVLCPGGEPLAPDHVLLTAECPTCHVRHRYLPNWTMIRHVPPPLVLVSQRWDGE